MSPKYAISRFDYYYGQRLLLHEDDTIIRQASSSTRYDVQQIFRTRRKIKRAQKNHRQACGFFAAGCDFKLENQIPACPPPKPGT
jgi:hypothetical protein